jgi:hypothetical protein
MSAGAAQAPANRMLAVLALLPLPIVLFAAWHYELAANIRVDYRWLVAAVFVLFAGLAGCAWLAARSGWRRVALLPVLAACVPLAGVIVFAGWVQVAAAILLAATALAVASLFRGTCRGDAAIALMVGLACVAAIVGWLLPLPIHHRGTYLAVALLLVAVRWPALRDMLRVAASGMRDAITADPAWSILLAGAATIASLGLWLPSLNYDDNAVHLILQSQLLADGYYHLDVQSQSWAVAPWANNVLHAIAALFAGQESRAAVAMLWLLLGIAGAWRLARALDASQAAALAAATVFAAQPLAGYFTTSMQVDGANAAILLHLAAIAARPAAARPGPFVLGILAGLLLALKTSNLLYVLPLLAWLCASAPSGTRLRWLARLCLGLLPVAASSYCYAWWITGNPLFPFYNAVFKSPYYPLENFRDLKWMAGVSWRSLWDLTFETNAYGQFFPGAAGIAVLATLPALAVDAARRRAPRWLALWAFMAGGALFWHMQYLRYVFPALAVLVVLGTVALARLVDRRAFAAAIVLLVGVDALLMPTSSWYLRDNDWALQLREGADARTAIVRKAIPERALLEKVMARDPDACVLMSDPKTPFVGAGHGHALSLHRRYDPELWRARNDAETDPSGGKWRALLARIGASHVILTPDVSPVLGLVLQDATWRRIDSEGSVELHARIALPGEWDCTRLHARRDQARRLVTE